MSQPLDFFGPGGFEEMIQIAYDLVNDTRVSAASAKHAWQARMVQRISDDIEEMVRAAESNKDELKRPLRNMLAIVNEYKDDMQQYLVDPETANDYADADEEQSPERLGVAYGRLVQLLETAARDPLSIVQGEMETQAKKFEMPRDLTPLPRRALRYMWRNLRKITEASRLQVYLASCIVALGGADKADALFMERKGRMYVPDDLEDPIRYLLDGKDRDAYYEVYGDTPVLPGVEQTLAAMVRIVDSEPGVSYNPDPVLQQHMASGDNYYPGMLVLRSFHYIVDGLKSVVKDVNQRRTVWATMAQVLWPAMELLGFAEAPYFVNRVHFLQPGVIDAVGEAVDVPVPAAVPAPAIPVPRPILVMGSVIEPSLGNFHTDEIDDPPAWNNPVAFYNAIRSLLDLTGLPDLPRPRVVVGLVNAVVATVAAVYVPEKHMPLELVDFLFGTLNYGGAFPVHIRFDSDNPEDPVRQGMQLGISGIILVFALLQAVSFAAAMIADRNWVEEETTDLNVKMKSLASKGPLEEQAWEWVTGDGVDAGEQFANVLGDILPFSEAATLATASGVWPSARRVVGKLGQRTGGRVGARAIMNLVGLNPFYVDNLRFVLRGGVSAFLNPLTLAGAVSLNAFQHSIYTQLLDAAIVAGGRIGALLTLKRTFAIVPWGSYTRRTWLRNVVRATVAANAAAVVVTFLFQEQFQNFGRISSSKVWTAIVPAPNFFGYRQIDANAYVRGAGRISAAVALFNLLDAFGAKLWNSTFEDTPGPSTPADVEVSTQITEAIEQLQRLRGVVVDIVLGLGNDPSAQDIERAKNEADRANDEVKAIMDSIGDLSLRREQKTLIGELLVAINGQITILDEIAFPRRERQEQRASLRQGRRDNEAILQDANRVLDLVRGVIVSVSNDVVRAQAQRTATAIENAIHKIHKIRKRAPSVTILVQVTVINISLDELRSRAGSLGVDLPDIQDISTQNATE